MQFGLRKEIVILNSSINMQIMEKSEYNMGNKNVEGNVVHSFKDKAEEGVRHFKSLFKEPQDCLIQEILEVISKFPHGLFRRYEYVSRKRK
jgi:hypothetical protein